MTGWAVPFCVSVAENTWVGTVVLVMVSVAFCGLIESVPRLSPSPRNPVSPNEREESPMRGEASGVDASKLLGSGAPPFEPHAMAAITTAMTTSENHHLAIL